jgi:hypothetical protein
VWLLKYVRKDRNNRVDFLVWGNVKQGNRSVRMGIGASVLVVRDQQMKFALTRKITIVTGRWMRIVSVWKERLSPADRLAPREFV